MTKYLKFKSNFVRNIAIMISGTALSQAIPIAISPILTRIYSPNEFGVLILFMSIVSVCSVIISLRYEKTIVQPRLKEDAISLTILSLLICFLISIIIFALIFIFKNEILELFEKTDLDLVIYWIPLTVLITGFYKILNQWFVRNKKFKDIAQSQVAKGATMSIGQIGFGSITTSSGLVVGYIIGITFSLIILFKNILKNNDLSIFKFDKFRILKNFKKFKNMPKYSTFGVLANTTSSQIPNLVIANLYGINKVGFFGLTFRVLNLPMSLFSEAIASTLFQKIAHLYNSDRSKIKILIIKISFVLICFTIPFISIIYVFGEDIFVFIFGEKWRQSGEIAEIVIFAVAIRFVVSPLSVVMLLKNNVKLGVFWQFTYLISICTTFYLISSWPIKDLIIAFTIHEVVLYTFYFILILKSCSFKNKT